MKNKILIYALSILLLSCSKNNLTDLIVETTTGTSLQSITPIGFNTYKVIFLLDGIPKSAICTETSLGNGLTQYRLANGSYEYFSLKLNSAGEISDLTYKVTLNCITKQAFLCQRQLACKIICVNGANMSCVLGWALQCALGMG